MAGHGNGSGNGPRARSEAWTPSQQPRTGSANSGNSPTPLRSSDTQRGKHEDRPIDPYDLRHLTLVNVSGALPKDAVRRLRDWVRRAFHGVIEELDLVDYAPPPFDEIDTGLFTRALEQEIGGHLLAFTSADLRTGDDDFFSYIFGGKDNRNSVAVVSTARLRSRDGRLPLERVGKVGLHELGHNFGLAHHYTFEAAEGEGYCPMSKGDYDRYGERSYVRAVIDGRGLRFCRRCAETMRRVTALLR